MYFNVVLLTYMFFMNIKYILYIIATDKIMLLCCCISSDNNSGCDAYRGRLETIRVSVISIGRV